MNNKRVLKKYPQAVCQIYKTEFHQGFRGKGVPIYIIKPSKGSKFSIGSGLTEKEAWQTATHLLGDDHKLTVESTRAMWE